MNAKLTWIGKVRRGSGWLSALSEGPTLQSKALLQIWYKNYPTWCSGADQGKTVAALGDYGVRPEDHTPVWTDRDGAMLSRFSEWWNNCGRSPTLDFGAWSATEHSGYTWVDLSQFHADALNAWAVENGFLPQPEPGQSPIPNFNIPGLPPVPSFPPVNWPLNFPWPPPIPSWWPVNLGALWPPIGDWNVGPLVKPPGWELTGLPWPPPRPGTATFPGTWPSTADWPLKQSSFVQSGLPPPPTGCPAGTHFDATSGMCQPDLPPVPAPKTTPSTTTPSSESSNLFPLLIVGGLLAVAVVALAFGGRSIGASSPPPRATRRRENPGGSTVVETVGTPVLPAITPIPVRENPSTYDERRRRSKGPHCILDKHEYVVYRVIGAPSHHAAIAYVQRRLKRTHGAGLRYYECPDERVLGDDLVTNLMHAGVQNIRYRSMRRPKRKRARRRRQRTRR